MAPTEMAQVDCEMHDEDPAAHHLRSGIGTTLLRFEAPGTPTSGGCCARRCPCCIRRCPCCGKCCACCRPGEPGEDGPATPPVEWTYGHALRYVVNDNWALGVLCPFHHAPPVAVRALLLALFVACAVFVQYAELAMGPICVREYLDQCPPWSAASHHTLGFPSKYITLDAPHVDVPDNARRRLHGLARSLQADTDVGGVAEGGSVEGLRGSFVSGLSRVFGRWEFDCDKPMCDLFYPQMIDYVSLVRLTNSFFGSSNAHTIPATSDAVIIGYCKCDGPIYEGIVRAKVSGGARTVVVSVVVQTVLPKVFRAFFLFAYGTSGTTGGRCPRFWACAGRLMVVLLLALVVMMLGFIFALKFDPDGWRNAVVISILNVSVLTPVLSFLQLALCMRADWPLRACGFGPPSEVLSERPLFCSECRGKYADLRDSRQGPDPTRLGLAHE